MESLRKTVINQLVFGENVVTVADVLRECPVKTDEDVIKMYTMIMLDASYLKDSIAFATAKVDGIDVNLVLCSDYLKNRNNITGNDAWCVLHDPMIRKQRYVGLLPKQSNIVLISVKTAVYRRKINEWVHASTKLHKK